MKNNKHLKKELDQSKDLYYHVITIRKKKMMGRWILGAIFYYSFWNYTWAKYLFWIGLFSELILLVFTLRIYFRLKSKIQKLEVELTLINT